MTRAHCALGVWWLAASLGCVRPALAEDGLLQHTRARAELGVSGRSDPHSQLTVLTPVVGLDYRFSHGFGAGFDWAFVIAQEAPTAPRRESALWFAGPGGPMFKVWYETASDAGERWQLYAGLNVPAAWLPRDVERRSVARSSYALAAATRGLWDAWLWVPEQMALAVGGGYRRPLAPQLRLRVDGAIAGSVSLSWLTPDVGALYGQLAPALELFAGELYLGVRVQGVVLAPQSDPLQWSASVYLGITREHWSLEARGLCNLDEPLGFAGAGLSVCGAWLQGTVTP